MTTLFLVRHGQTVWHADNRYAGVSDIALTATGRRQAARVGVWAAGADLDAVWCSPLGRARTTAAPAVATLRLALRIDGDLREVHYGVAEGRTLTELDPAVVAAFHADPVLGSFPRAEDPRGAAARGVAALRRIAARHPGERVLVVTHNTLMRLTLCSLLGIPLSGYREVFPRIRNCAPTELRLDGHRTALLAYNVPLGD
ncbi:MAG TPA: histidine phosphatase family protein [Actinomadura sp.]|jgi:probable phosphoglycerate mutase|nr:histidine phosphatase family protein [Actinomadura sp.]